MVYTVHDMDILNVGEKKYIKATTLAKRFGYTADYIGQLCRSSKVDAQLVGRSWYVVEDSLELHKKDRYRTTQVKSLKSVHEDLKNTSMTAEKHTNEYHPRSHFYIHSHLKPLQYDEDRNALIPLVNKPTHKVLTVDLADSQKVAISSKSVPFVFETPTVPKIQFKGSLKVTDIEDTPVEYSDGSTHLHPTEVSKFKIHKRLENKVISAKPVLSDPKFFHLTTHTSDEIVYSHIEKNTDLKTQNPFAVFLIYISFISIALSFVFLLFSLELEISASAGSIVYSYVFSLDHVVYLLKNL